MYLSEKKIKTLRCRHKFGILKCNILTNENVEFIRDTYFTINNKIDRDYFILNCCEGVPVKRRRSLKLFTETDRPAKRGLTINYTLPIQNEESLKVCREVFIFVFGVKESRILRLVRNFYFKGQLPAENRGGWQRKKVEKELEPKHFKNVAWL